MKQFTEIVTAIETNKNNMEFLPTGLNALDEFLDGGFMRKELVVLGGATGKGKSFIAGHVFSNIAKKGFKSAYFSLEISNEMIVSRLIGSEANIKPTRVMAGLLTQEEQSKRVDAKTSLEIYEEFMFFYDDLYLLVELEKEILTHKYDFIVIDFIQNIITKRGDEYERLSFVSLSLQQLAKKANCCILVLSQLSNTVAREKTGSVVEYRGSGSIATVCDLGFFIEPVEGFSETDGFSLRLRKNRRGISGVGWNFAFKQPGGKITNL